MKKWKLDRIISIATLVTSVAALALVLKRPAPVASPQSPAQAVANAQSFQEKLAQLDEPVRQLHLSLLRRQSQAPDRKRPRRRFPVLSSQPRRRKLSLLPRRFTLLRTRLQRRWRRRRALSPRGQLSANSDLGAMPNILDQQVSFDGDQAHGQFLVNVAGKNVWITVSGRLGSKDGYATFDPTEFKVGDLNIPVSLVNGALQQRLSEQRDRLKLPDNVGGVQVENGQLVLTQKYRGFKAILRRGHVRIPLPRIFYDPLLRLVVHVHQSQPLAVALLPFQVIEQTPMMITADIGSLANGARQRHEMGLYIAKCAAHHESFHRRPVRRCMRRHSR